MKHILATICLLIVPSIALADYTSLQSDGNLVAYFPCEDNTNTATVTNAVGTDGTINVGGPNTEDISTTGPTAWQTLAFNCDDERIGIDTVTITGSFSVAFWANRDDTAAAHTMLGNSANSTDRLMFDGSTVLRLTIDGTNYDLSVSDTTNWHHYTVIYRADDDTIDLIVDGVETDVDNAGPSSLSWVLNRMSVHASSTSPFNGQYSDVFIFDRDLSLAEAQDLYNGPSTGILPLIHYYRQQMGR